jgi:Phage portal protein
MEKDALDVAFSDAAPAGERLAAQATLQKSAVSGLARDLIPRSELAPVIAYINDQVADAAVMSKSLSRNNLIPFPSRAAARHEPGMQSVWLDDMQLTVMGDYYERPSVFTFDSMRSMVEQTPVLNAVIMTRIRQMQRFCKITDNDTPGFQIRLRNHDDNPSREDLNTIRTLQSFFLNCGFESNPRKRLKLKRDNFADFMAKAVRDSLTMDSMPVETEFKRNKALGMDGIYAVDGATIRLCTDMGYQGDDEIFALQVIQGRIRSVYTHDDLIYRPRNPRTDVLSAGYGLSETELLIRVVTGFLNAFSYNTKYFDSNAIPKGILHLSGNYTEEDIQGFKRYWNAMVKGVSNWWTLPVLVSKDQESKASFENLGAEVNEMLFSKWMIFLVSIICAIYGMSPEEINFEAFSAGKSNLSGNDTQEKLANSKDSGLEPLMSYFENTNTDYIVSDFSDRFEFWFTGRESRDPARAFEEIKLSGTVNELRATRGDDKIAGKWGDAPLNKDLIPLWQAEKTPDIVAAAQAAARPPGAAEAKPGESAKPRKAPKAGVRKGKGNTQPAVTRAGRKGTREDQALAKSFGLPVYHIEV